MGTIWPVQSTQRLTPQNEKSRKATKYCIMFFKNSLHNIHLYCPVHNSIFCIVVFYKITVFENSSLQKELWNQFLITVLTLFKIESSFQFAFLFLANISE